MSNGTYDPQGGYRQPPPPPQDYGQPQPLHHPPKKSKKVPMVIAIVVIVVIAAVAGAFLLMGGGSESGPEGAFSDFVDAINSGDAETALHNTDAHFLPASEFDDAVDNFEDIGDGDIDIVSTEIISKEDLSSGETEDYEAYIAELEEKYGIEVEDYAKIHFVFKIGDESQTDNGDLPCIKVDGEWYLGISADFNDESPIIPEDDQGTPEKTFEAFVDAYNSEDFTGACLLTDASFMTPAEFDIAVGYISVSGTTVEIISVDTTFSDDMSSDDTEDLEENITIWEAELGIDVEDYALLDYTLEIDIEDYIDTEDNELPCVKVDGVWYLVLFSGDDMGFEDATRQATPENAMDSYIESFMGGDYAAALDVTDAYFLPSDEYNTILTEIEGISTGGYEITLLSSDAEYEVDMTPTEIADMESDLAYFESEYGVTIDDYAQLSYSMRIDDGGISTEDGELYCVQIDGLWYLCVFYYAMSGP